MKQRELPYAIARNKKELFERVPVQERSNFLLAFYDNLGVHITEAEITRQRIRTGSNSRWRTIDNIGLGKYIGTRD
jgi:hypothetical protein